MLGVGRKVVSDTGRRRLAVTAGLARQRGVRGMELLTPEKQGVAFALVPAYDAGELSTDGDAAYAAPTEARSAATLNGRAVLPRLRHDLGLAPHGWDQSAGERAAQPLLLSQSKGE